MGERTRWLAGVLLGLTACAGETSDHGQPMPDGTAPPADAAIMDAASGMDASMLSRPDGGALPDAAALDGAGGGPAPGDAGALGAFDAGAATASNGGTITFQQIGAAGWYPSRRDPASGACDAVRTDTCCMTRHELETDELTPWNEDLIMTLRGPIVVSQLAVYQPLPVRSGEWARVAAWDARAAQSAEGFSFDGDATAGATFAGLVGNQCLVDVASAQPFPCGAGSVPYCPEPAAGQAKHYGWSDEKLFVMLLSMPHASDAAIAADKHCGNDAADNWYDAPWIGFSHGELVRSGKFGDCHCYAKDPAMWWLGDGCGQLNAFEVVNDNNDAMNLDVFSSNFFGYQGYIGEGPCGGSCDTGALGASVDLIDKGTSQEATAGAVAIPGSGPGAAFVRPSTEPRYFIALFDLFTRTVQLAIISPARVPPAVAQLLPELPDTIEQRTVDALLELRLPD